MRRILSCAWAAAVVGATLDVQAQSMGKQGDLSVAAERLSGLSMGSISVDRDGPFDEVDTDYRSFRFLTSNASAGPLTTILPVFSTPRIGVDYFLADRFSLGGSLGFVSTGWDAPGDDINVTAFLLAMRAGYWIPLNETLSFWPRGGLAIMTASQSDDDNDQETSATLPVLSLEAPLMIALGPAFLQLAVTVDAAIGGSGETSVNGDTISEFDVSAYELGLQAGLGIVF